MESTQFSYNTNYSLKDNTCRLFDNTRPYERFNLNLTDRTKYTSNTNKHKD